MLFYPNELRLFKLAMSFLPIAGRMLGVGSWWERLWYGLPHFTKNKE